MQPEVSEITSEPAFAAMASEWDGIVASATGASVFLSHAWFTAAWAWRREAATLCALSAKRGGRIVAVLPLVRLQARALAARRLELLTVPDTQFADLVAGDADAEIAAQAFAAALAARSDWDVATFDYLPAGSVVVRSLVPALERRGLRAAVRARGTNPCIALDASWSGYYASRSRRLKKAVNLAANRLARSGTIRIEHVAGPDIDDATFDRALADVCDVSSRSWKRATGTTLEQPGPGAFIRRLSGLARERGWLSIWLLYRDGHALATEYQLAAGGHVYALRADFVAETDDISPGTHLFRALLESSFGRGLSRYHLGPGDNPYKRRWSDDGTPMQRVIVYNRTWRGRLERLGEEAARPVLRAVRDRFRRRDAERSAAGDEPSEP